MKKFTLFLLFTMTAHLVLSQNTLTLHQAILEQHSTLAPDKLKGLQWVPGTEHISYIKDNQLVIQHWKDEKVVNKIDLNKLIEVFEKELNELKSWPAIHWLNSNEFYFVRKATIYFFNTSSEGAKQISLSNSDDVANIDMHKTSKHIAFTRDNNLYCHDGSRELTISSDSNRNFAYGQAVHRYEFGIGKGTFWSPDGEYLAFYKNDQRDVTEYPLVNIQTTPASHEPIKYPMAGAKSEKVTLGIFDVANEKTIYLNTNPERDVYLTNVTWSPDQKFVYVSVVNRDQNHMWLNKYDAENGELVKTLFEEQHEKYVEPLHPLYFINDKRDQFIYWSQEDGYMHLYLMNDDGKEIRQLTKGKWVVKKWLGQGSEGKFVFVEGTGEKPTETYLYKVELATGTFEVIDNTPGTHRGKLQIEKNIIIDEFSSISVPGMTWISDVNGKNKEVLLNAENPLKDFQVSAPEIMTVPSGSLSLYARMIKPSHFDPSKKYPVLVYVYNGPHAQMVRNRWLGGAPMWMYVMAERGFIIFTVDGRGSANRGRAFEQEIFRRIGDVELEDQLAGVEYLKTLSFVDVDKMAIHGWSYGGFMTISMMLRHPDVFEVGVAGGPVVDWKYYEVMYTERYMDTPQTNPDGFKKSSVLQYTTNLKGKLLTIHGLVDDVVVPQHNFQFQKECIDNGVQVDFYAYPGHPHNVRGKDRVHLMTKVLDYIEDGLK